MKELNYFEQVNRITERMAHGGVFLSVAGEKPNTMTIGWGAASYIWNRPVFIAMVRPQRYTHELLERTDVFTVSVPTRNLLRAELAFAGRASGRDGNKFESHGLTAVPALKVPAPIVGECGLHLECRILLRQEMSPGRLSQEIIDYTYKANDEHELYFGEVLACYSTDE